MIFTTSICANYLPKARVLAKSVKAAHPDSRFIVCLLEREVPTDAQGDAPIDDIVLARNLGFAAFEPFIFKHAIVEASTAVKGQLFIHLMERYADERKFVYLDPDIKVFTPLAEVEAALDAHAIVLTPHLCHPEETLDAVRDNELSALQHGIFNLGFLAVARTAEADRFIRWWASRLEMYCYDDTPRGIFTDQKWIDLAPCYFEVHILKHPGYNVAPWNLSRRRIEDTGGAYTVNGEPLRFYHFSGLDSGAGDRMTKKYAPDPQDAMHGILAEYKGELEAAGQRTLGKTRWSYDDYRSGDRIDPHSRILYRELPGNARDRINPFDKNDDYFRRYQNHRQLYRFVLNVGRMTLSRLFRR